MPGLRPTRKNQKKATPKATKNRPKKAAIAVASLIPGVTPVLSGKLAQLGLLRSLDLVLHLPLRYEDETRVTPISAAHGGAPVQIEALVQSTEILYRPRRQLLVRVADASGEAALRFFHFYPSQVQVLEPGTRLRIFGELRPGFFGGEMIHPRYQVLRDEMPLPNALTPVYPVVSGLTQPTLRRLIEAALVRESLEEALPASIIERCRLAPLKQTVLELHHPRPGEDLDAFQARTHPAWRRIKFDELLAQQLSMRKHYRERRARSAPALIAQGGQVGALLGALPYRLTQAQHKAWGEIETDMGRAHPMNRLLQGDVGSGKTVVAALAALRAAENGRQTAVMAPTEILAEQHYRKFSEWLAPLGVRIAWLTGSQTGRERNAASQAIASGEALLAVGTHALFQQGIEFHALGLVVVDEQHRFGVAQRLALREKSAHSGEKSVNSGEALPGEQITTSPEPHMLMMSATPIPRTLSMSYYADLDVSVIDQMPPGRTPVLTKLVSATRRDEVLGRIRESCAGGQQAYWVCPLIEESETLDLQTAIDTHAALSAELTGLAVGLVHGRLPSAEKAAVMKAFIHGEIQVLVATTVIEVGVDVPNASLMVIEHAERFGLAQLHQLRGRVGRGSAQSACVLLYQNPLSEGARQRLKVIYENTDGFIVAQEDLKIRGPGEYLGKRQSGAPLLRFADLVADEAILVEARDAAEWLLDNDEASAQIHMERWLGSRSRYMSA
ncbi:MAG: ATP-dependent DNA helicase RecG [Burkholderiales bacterium]